jgi:hypothetical protein
MAQSNWRGMAELNKLFDTLSPDAEAALKEYLPEAAASILALQKDAVPVRTGDLWRGLTTESLDDGLKVRAGLTGRAATGGRSDLFYGRVVEFGRHAQTVLVQRRRRVGGRLRSSRGRKIAADLEATYSMKVPASAPRPFVDTSETEAVMLRTMEAVADIIADKMQE